MWEMTMEYDSAIKRDEAPIFAIAWMNLEATRKRPYVI